MSQATDNLREAIVQSATEGIESTLIDGESVREQSLDSRLRALREAESQNGAIKSHFGMRMTRLVSPGGGNS